MLLYEYMQINCTTYDYGLYTKLPCLLTWPIFITIYDTVGYQYFIHMYILDFIDQLENTKLLLLQLSDHKILLFCRALNVICLYT